MVYASYFRSRGYLALQVVETLTLLLVIHLISRILHFCLFTVASAVFLPTNLPILRWYGVQKFCNNAYYQDNLLWNTEHGVESNSLHEKTLLQQLCNQSTNDTTCSLLASGPILNTAWSSTSQRYLDPPSIKSKLNQELFNKTAETRADFSRCSRECHCNTTSLIHLAPLAMVDVSTGLWLAFNGYWLVDIAPLTTVFV